MGDTGYLSNKGAVDAYVAGERKFFGHFPGRRSFGPNGQHAKAANASRYQANTGRPGCTSTATPLVADVGNFAFGGGQGALPNTSPPLSPQLNLQPPLCNA